MSIFILKNVIRLFKKQKSTGEFWQPNPERDWLKIMYFVVITFIFILILNYILLLRIDSDWGVGDVEETTLKTTNLEKAITSFTKRQAVLERYIKIPPDIIVPN